MSIDVIKAGLLTTLQDRGRVGHAALGIGRAGPMDATLFRLAQALVGNDHNAAALEITVIGPKLRFARRCRIALTGDFARARIDNQPVKPWRPLQVEAGAVLDCGALASGTRGYVAMAGGIAVEPMLGSRATDVNARLGAFDGRAVRAGDQLPLHRETPSTPATTNWSLDPSPWFDSDVGQPIHCIAGRHREALDAASIRALEFERFRIGVDSNRVGLRLDGPVLRLRERLELVSEPVSFGTVQLPPGGQPIVLMAEHPTTGGYPRIGQIAAIDLGRLAQRRPGESLRLAAITLAAAQARYRAQQQQLGALIRAIHERIQA